YKATPTSNSSSITEQIETSSEIGGNYGATNFWINTGSDNVTMDVTLALNGSLKSDTEVGNYKLMVNSTNRPLGEWTYNKTWGVGQGFQFFGMYRWRDGRYYMNKTTTDGKIAQFVSPFNNYSFTNHLTVELVVYNGAELDAAVSRLESYLSDSYVQSVASADSIASARTKINSAKALLKQREKTQSQIDTMVSELDNFRFETKTINLIKDIHTNFGDRTFAEHIEATTEGTEIDYSDFLNVDYKLSNTSLNQNNFNYGDWNTKNFYLPVGSYSFTYSAKSSSGVQVTRAGYSHMFDVKIQVYRGTLNTKDFSSTNGQNLQIWVYNDVKSNDTMSLSSNTFTYTGTGRAVGGQYSDVGTGIISPQFPAFASSMATNFVYQYSTDGGTTWDNSVTLTDAGTYTINFRLYNSLNDGISSQVQRSGTISGGVSISKADIALTIGRLTVPYGGDLPTQNTLLGMVTDAQDLYNLAGVTGNMNITQLREKLGSMIELSLSGFDMSDSTNNFAKSYTMNVASYKNMEGRDKSWGDNVVISFRNNSNQSCYTVDTIKINLNWTGGVTTEYDGQGGKRPTAVVQNLAAPLQQSDIIDIGVTAIEGSADGATPELAVGGTAVNYGRYIARVRLRDYSESDPDSAYLQNYSISNPTCEFGISKRNITVEIKATGAVYGSANANDMVSQWTDLANNLDSKISITRGSIVAGQTAPGVFRLDIDKTGRGGNAGVPDGGVYLNAGAYDISGTTINDNYNITFSGSAGNGSSNPAKSTFTVRKASLTMDLHQIAPKRY
ncbi:MAG: hypothetical protein K2I79_02295, partial [Clostridia bacterium]|nr:hypothetical protein [Clostridia bacterium]